MKYRKAEIHSIFASKADAVCADGSDATAESICTVGPQIGLACEPGTAATVGKCKAGTAAPAPNANCSGGSSVGAGCATGLVNPDAAV